MQQQSSVVVGSPTQQVDRASGRHQHLNTFSELTAKIQQAGLMERRYGFYWTSISLAVVALAGVATAAVLLGDTWWQLLLAAGLEGARCYLEAAKAAWATGELRRARPPSLWRRLTG